MKEVDRTSKSDKKFLRFGNFKKNHIEGIKKSSNLLCLATKFQWI